jgi:hypothetical protein
LIGVNQLVCEVLLHGILAHLDAGSPNYSGVVGAGLGLHSEKFPKKYPVGLDPQEGFAEVHEDRSVEDTVGVEVEVLDADSSSPLKKSLAGRDNPRSANRVNMGISSGFFSMGYGSPAVAHHISTSFSCRNPLLRSTSKSSVFALDFFHSWLGFGRGGDTGGDVPAADPAASSRDLFFPPAVFKLFDGEGFILEVHRVFTRIRSGATAVVSGGGTLGSTLPSKVAVCTGGGF